MEGTHDVLRNISNLTTAINPYYSAKLVSAFSVLAVLILLVNSLVVFLFLTSENLRTKTNTILVSLACSDLLNGLVVIPFHISINVYVKRQWLRLASMVLFRFTAASTMLHILFATLERHVCILLPLRYHSLVTKSRILKALFSVWFLSTISSVLSLTWISVLSVSDEYDHLEDPSLHNSELLRFEFAYALCTFLLLFFAPMLVMVYSFVKILREIARHGRLDTLASDMIQISSPLNSATSDSSASRERGDSTLLKRTKAFYKLESKPVLIFLAMFLFFTITWASWYVQNILLSVSPQHYWYVGGIWPAFARSATSLVNPLLYCFIKKDFRQAAKKRWRKTFQIISGENSPGKRLASRKD